MMVRSFVSNISAPSPCLQLFVSLEKKICDYQLPFSLSYMLCFIACFWCCHRLLDLGILTPGSNPFPVQPLLVYASKCNVHLFISVTLHFRLAYARMLTLLYHICAPQSPHPLTSLVRLLPIIEAAQQCTFATFQPFDRKDFISENAYQLPVRR